MSGWALIVVGYLTVGLRVIARFFPELGLPGGELTCSATEFFAPWIAIGVGYILRRLPEK